MQKKKILKIMNTCLKYNVILKYSNMCFRLVKEGEVLSRRRRNTDSSCPY